MVFFFVFLILTDFGRFSRFSAEDAGLDVGMDVWMDAGMDPGMDPGMHFQEFLHEKPLIFRFELIFRRFPRAGRQDGRGDGCGMDPGMDPGMHFNVFG